MKDKKELIQIKENAIKEHQEREKNRSDQCKEMKRNGEKLSLNKLMEIESQNLDRIKKEKEEVSRQAVEQLIELNNKRKIEEIDLQSKIKEAKQLANRKYMEIKELDKLDITKQIKMPLLGMKAIDVPMRESSTIHITFTPRIFPTPERESTKEVEEEWLNKQAEHRRTLIKRVIPSDLSANELNPIWLRKKGDSLFQIQDYEAAVIAYTEAIKLDPKMYSAYSNRAACHIYLRNYFKALEDSSMTLDLCVPAVVQNLKSRLHAYIRRGVAFCNLQMYKEGLVEYKAAYKLKPGDETIKTDIDNLEQFLKNKVSNDE